VQVRVCRPARQVGSPVLQGSFPRLATLRPRGPRVGHCVWVARLDHVVHAFFRSRDALLLMDFSSRRVHEVVTRRAPTALSAATLRHSEPM